MKRICLALLTLTLLSCSKTEREFIIQGEAQGTTYGVKYIAQEQRVSKKQLDSIFKVIDQSLSTYQPNSYLSLLNQGKSKVVDSHFITVFKQSKQIYEQSNGVFDPSIGVLVNAWGFGPQKSKATPTPLQVDSLKMLVNFSKVVLNHNSIQMPARMYLDFNAIAQGYSADVLLEFLTAKGITNAIVEVGGEIKASGKNTITQKSWTVGIDDPLQTPEQRKLMAQVALQNQGMATSGNYRKIKTDSVTGKKYVHIINPKTGYPEKTNVLSATVIAPTAMVADGFATVFMIYSVPQTKAFLQNHPELAVMLVYESNGTIKVFENQSFQNLKK